MRAVLDACVLFPPVLRDLLLGMAEAGLYEPKWSDRILEEWARAVVKLGPGAEAQARGMAVLMRQVFPRATVAAAPVTTVWTLPRPKQVPTSTPGKGSPEAPENTVAVLALPPG